MARGGISVKMTLEGKEFVNALGEIEKRQTEITKKTKELRAQNRGYTETFKALREEQKKLTKGTDEYIKKSQEIESVKSQSQA